jgi:hypothetical protein
MISQAGIALVLGCMDTVPFASSHRGLLLLFCSRPSPGERCPQADLCKHVLPDGSLILFLPYCGWLVES